MVLLNTKSSENSSSSSPLSLVTSKEKPTVSFSDLLRGVSDAKDKKIVQNGALVLALGSDEKTIKLPKTSSKTATLTSSLNTQETKVQKRDKEPLELNPKLVSGLSTAEIKTLMNDAKNYLKSKIQESDGFKKAEIKELPTTLKGLVEVAKKFGMDVSKITIEEVKEHSSKTLKQESKELNTEVLKELSQEKKEAKTEVLKEIPINKKEQVAEVKNETPQEKKELKREISKEMPMAPKEVITDKKSQPQEVKQEVKQDVKIAQNSTFPQQVEHSQKNIDEKYIDKKQNEIEKEVKATPLFKAQSVSEHTTTEQIVQAKATSASLKSEQKTPKERADDALRLLLGGEKVSKEAPSLTADFSVNSAKVIAPSLTSENNKSLEKLLQGESFISEQPSQAQKTDSLGVNKADSFEVKINEAKQMIKYLSDDIKNAINDYKSPFTRVKVQLNPQNLGEVDLTVVQRGKNLHVNISSNNTAINTLSMNINELKAQLNNSGINSATFNFNSSSQNGDNSSGASQQQRQNEQKAHSEYSHFENEETHEEIISSLEIIVPRYI